MGRPLKVKKLNPDADPSGAVDYGYPNNGQTNNDYNNSEPGVTGGYTADIRVTANFNLPAAGTCNAVTTSNAVSGTGTIFSYNGMVSGATVYANGINIGVINAIANNTSFTLTANSAANVTNATITFDTGPVNSYILRQKGKKKFMVVGEYNVQDEGIAAGAKYFIKTPDTTDWSQFGAGPDAGAGKIFTSTANGTNVTVQSGVVGIVDVCTLVDGTPSAGEMSIEVYNDGTTTHALTLTNHWVRDFDNNVTPEDGTNTKYVATIFNDNGDTVPDPAANLDQVWTIVGIENWC